MSARHADAGTSALVVLGVVAAVSYADFLADVVLPGDLPWLTPIVSILEEPGQRNSGVLRSLDVISGLLTLVLVPFLWRALPRGLLRLVGVAGLAAFAAAGAVTGILSSPCATCAADVTRAAEHDVLSIVSVGAVTISAAAVALALGPTGPRWLVRASWAACAGCVATDVAFDIAYRAQADLAAGLAQRAQILLLSGWIMCLAVHAARARAARRRAHPAAG